MRGIFIADQCEYRLEVEGDEWCQGGDLLCQFKVLNRGSAKTQLSGLALYLALANLKKLKAKDPAALAVVAGSELNVPDLDPGQAFAQSWSYALDRNATISDKSQSFYMLFGRGAAADLNGQLPLNVRPHPHVQVLHALLQSTASFVLKELKFKEGWVEARFKPPQSAAYATVEQLLLGSSFANEVLKLNFCYKVKKLRIGGIKKEELSVERELDPRQYLLGPDLVDREVLTKVIKEALGEVESGF